jgi:hypothetical protein
VLDTRVYVYTLTVSPKRVMTLETCDNPRGMVSGVSLVRLCTISRILIVTGLIALSTHESNSLLVIPGREYGQVCDMTPHLLTAQPHLVLVHAQIQIVDVRDSIPSPFIVVAHETSLSCLAISAVCITT